VTINTKETPSLLRTFWSSEIISERLYGFLAARYDDPDLKRDIVAIGTMERAHAQVWNKIAKDVHGVSFQVSLGIKFKIVLLKLLSLILPLTIFIHYLEHGEKKAILDYAGLLEIYKDDEKARTIITNVILQEIGHQWHMMEQIADKRLYIEKVKEAIPGMTAGIIETLGLVIGLLAAHAKTSMIGLTGLIAMVGGMIAEMSVSYISSKGHHDLNEGRDRELTIKKEVNPTLLRREFENDLAERGIGSETVRLILESIGDDAGVLFSLVKTIRSTAEALQPKESLKTRHILHHRSVAGLGTVFHRDHVGLKSDHSGDYRLSPCCYQYIDSRALHGGSVREKNSDEYHAQPVYNHGNSRPHVSGRFSSSPFPWTWTLKK